VRVFVLSEDLTNYALIVDTKYLLFITTDIRVPWYTTINQSPTGQEPCTKYWPTYHQRRGQERRLVCLSIHSDFFVVATWLVYDPWH